MKITTKIFSWGSIFLFGIYFISITIGTMVAESRLVPQENLIGFIFLSVLLAGYITLLTAGVVSTLALLWESIPGMNKVVEQKTRVACLICSFISTPLIVYETNTQTEWWVYAILLSLWGIVFIKKEDVIS